MFRKLVIPFAGSPPGAIAATGSAAGPRGRQ
jgi:hypothetical protein